jgi:hypothetical protein
MISGAGSQQRSAFTSKDHAFVGLHPKREAAFHPKLRQSRGYISNDINLPNQFCYFRSSKR